MKIRGAKAAMDKEWKKLETILSMATGESHEQGGGYSRSTKETKNKVHFATLMDICHLENAELEPTLHKYKGRVLLRGDIVKDESGAYAVKNWTGLVWRPKWLPQK